MVTPMPTEFPNAGIGHVARTVPRLSAPIRSGGPKRHLFVIGIA
jgi:hypothetical protein